MTRKFNMIRSLALAAGIMVTSNGCALFTAQRVGTFVATQAGKKVVKDIKEDHDQKKAAMVSVTTSADAAKAADILRDLCMHIVVFNPSGKDRESVPAETIERERAIYMAEGENKPAEIQEKIVAGKLDKFYAGSVLTEQPWVKDDKLSVQKALEQALGAGTRIEEFVRFQVGA